MSDEYDAHKQLFDKLAAVLRGNHPVTQSTALGEALALWIAGHDPSVREEVTQRHFEMVRELVPVLAPKLDKARAMVEALLNQAGTKQ